MDITVPTFPESVNTGTLINWLKNEGDAVALDDIVAEVETDKVVFEVLSPTDGVLGAPLVAVNAEVTSGQKIAEVIAGAAPAAHTKAEETTAQSDAPASASAGNANAPAGPAARKAMDEAGVRREQVPGTGKDGRILKGDVANANANIATSAPTASSTALSAGNMPVGETARVPMSAIRKRIAERLLDASQNTAMLTTFNEVNMHAVISARKAYKDAFERTHGVRLGFMSFFVRAATQALLRFPDVNAAIDGEDLVYHNYCDVGIAVSTDKGLVVPVLRHADKMSFAEIEAGITDFAERARKRKLTLEEMTGGTFSITNGGVFGSMLSTPILNPPQSAILGMHAIVERPVVENGAVVVRPIMYLALSYDHRVIDGKTSVSFLRTIKEYLEDPVRLMMDV